ncbi:WbuC family cupin fold metalloprotein [Trichloromonas sp.]|uniref:WbuC family cupin fold metalloprotein n=1 Tax=Trichloromonas sp. TaxID=3069249 RepID=UPI002A37FFF4|nr:WbuC family cupin fold metalloprotein [Trichloromonas sp.]
MKPVSRRIDESLLNELSRAAGHTPRRRLNHNFHRDYLEPCQRLLNAVEPGTYVRPHRHLDPPRPECFVLLRGRMTVLLFADGGDIAEIIPLTATGPCWGVDIPPGAWHSLVSLEPGTVFFETKPGPYLPLSDKDFAPWAPAEGSKKAEEYLEFLTGRVHERGTDA